MKLHSVVVLGISIVLVLAAAGCCGPIAPCWLTGQSSPDVILPETPATQPAEQPPATTTDANGISWMSDIDAAVTIGRAEGKPILLDFWGAG